MTVSEQESAAMHRALALAETVRGRTSPNPAVGAVILDQHGELVGEGATAPAGGPHAEVVALQTAGERARGATAVVTLEPCAHTGRTGPCTKALLEAGISRVIFAVADPNPQAAGGAQVLLDAGVEVLGGEQAEQVIDAVLRPWLTAVELARPFVTWKFAATLDGRSAAEDGSARWISSPASRADAHLLRAQVDAIIVGSGTVLVDDPQLTARDVDGALLPFQPLRVVLDRRHRVSPHARVLDRAAETMLVDIAAPRFVLKSLFDHGVRHALLEGGPTVAGAFLEQDCVDEVVVYFAPKLLGAGASALAHAGIISIDEAVTLELVSVSHIGPDVKIVARPLRVREQTGE